MSVESLAQSRNTPPLEERALLPAERQRLREARLPVQNALIALYVERNLPSGILEEYQRLKTAPRTEEERKRVDVLRESLRGFIQRHGMQWATPEGIGYARAFAELIDRAEQATEMDQLDKAQRELAFVRTVLRIAPHCPSLKETMKSQYDTELGLSFPPQDPETRLGLLWLQRELKRELTMPTPFRNPPSNVQ